MDVNFVSILIIIIIHYYGVVTDKNDVCINFTFHVCVFLLRLNVCIIYLNMCSGIHWCRN